jgi:transcriptional repressor NrdR
MQSELHPLLWRRRNWSSEKLQSIIIDVKKRSGSTEVFMPEKVVVSVVKSGAPYEITREIADSLSSRTESVMESSAIREYVLSELRSRGQTSVVDSWKSYDSEHKSSS